MFAKEIISYYIPALKSSATGDDALAQMDEFRCSHLPVVDKGKYHGLVSDNEILDWEDPGKKLSTVKTSLQKPYVNVYSHIYEVISLVHEHKITVVPVLDDKEEYIGIISIQDLAFNFATITNAAEPGGVVILELNARDYSMAQIAQIVESDNAKILSSYAKNSAESMKVEVVLKISKKDLSAIISSFSRYNYDVKATFHESRFDEDIQRRYEQFMNYLNM